MCVGGKGGGGAGGVISVTSTLKQKLTGGTRAAVHKSMHCKDRCKEKRTFY